MSRKGLLRVADQRVIGYRPFSATQFLILSARFTQRFPLKQWKANYNVCFNVYLGTNDITISENLLFYI